MRGQKKWIAIVFAGTLACAHGQWLNYPAPGTPRTKDGKPNLSAPAPRASKGRPDLSGVWIGEPAKPGEIERMLGDVSFTAVPGDDTRTYSRYFFNILADFKPEDAPIRKDVAAELKRKRTAALGYSDSPTTHCMPVGMPTRDLFSFAPVKIIQAPNVIVMLYEVDDTHRQVYMDGRKLPVDPQPAWLGYSVGKWDGDTLAVDTAGLTDKSWLDAFGTPHSEAMQLHERFHRRDFGHMDVEATVDDPTVFTKPITIKFMQLLVPDSDILESFCDENEKDRPHIASH